MIKGPDVHASNKGGSFVFWLPFNLFACAPLFPKHITNSPRHTRVKPKLVPKFAFHHQNGKGQMIIIRKRKQVTMINDE